MKILSDSRQKHKKVYKIWDIVITAFIAVIANQNTWDALNTQKNIDAAIEAKADYIIALNPDHSSFFQDVAYTLMMVNLICLKLGALKSAYQISVKKAISSVITHEYFQIENIKWYHDYNSLKKDIIYE